MLLQAAIAALLAQACVGIVYDSYTRQPASDEQIEYYKAQNLTADCTNDIEPCRDDEPRRMDGSCVNPNFPSDGVYHSPLRRVLEPIYQEGTPDIPRLSISGNPLPNARAVRKRLLLEGKVSDPEFTQLVAYAAVVTFADTGSVHDTLNYLYTTTNCCTEEGKSDHMCTPIKVFDDDSTHQFSDVRCLNLTRPISFQSTGCAPKETTLTRYEKNTSPYDCSFLYRPMEPVPDAREHRDGLLRVEIEDGSEWPLSEGPLNYTCFSNVAELNETRCFGVVSASILPVNIFTVLYYRLHNIIARELKTLNPHWTDDQLFYAAREILIAFNNQINYYELMPILLGKEYAYKSGLLSKSNGFREVFDPTVRPQASLDFMMAMRWFHTVQEGTLKMYDENNYYWKEEPIVNHTLRIGFLSKNNHFAAIMRGGFVQPGGKHDNCVDSHIAETGLGDMQRATDLTSADLEKDRLFGFQPYVNYLEHCGFGKPNTWEELAEHLGWEYTEILTELYDDPSLVDFLVGMWGEGPTKGGYIPKTTACMLADQMEHAMRGDRHWYESAKRVNAFTRDQLKAIRSVSLSAMICAGENKIKTITRDPFRRISSRNPLVSCDDIPRWDLSPWKEDVSSQNTNRGKESPKTCKYSRK